MEELRYSDYYNSYRRTGYVYGNTATDINVMPQPQKEETKRKLKVVKPRKHKKHTRNLYTANEMHINKVRLGVIVVALVCLCMSAVNYLTLKQELYDLKNTINSKNNIYIALKTQNDTTESDLRGGVDYNYVYESAINELGMKYANQEQIIVYNSTDMECVKQLQDIPQ